MIICSNFENTMNKVLRWLLLAVPFIPLLFLGKTLYPQITPKVIVFRIIEKSARGEKIMASAYKNALIDFWQGNFGKRNLVEK